MFGFAMTLTDLADRLQQVDTTAMCDADKTLRVMDHGIRARSAGIRIAAPAFTVRCRGDFLAVLRAIESAPAGHVIVVDGQAQEIALGGELFARGALARNLAGIIVDGGYRDLGYVATCPLPIYSRFTTPLAGTTSRLGQLQLPVVCGGVAVNPGDVVLADDEGIIVVSPADLDSLLASAAAIKDAEGRLIEHLNNGGTLSDGLNLADHVAALEQGGASTLRFLL
jgi:4-hydroxy-4-methyl-2-oxoglutarate aldolase